MLHTTATSTSVQGGTRRARTTALRSPVIVWDTETTGLGPKARILEIALRLVYAETDSPKEVSFLINPSQSIRNSHVHGISNDMVRGKPTFKEIWPRIVLFVERCAVEDGGRKPILVAHNAKFDKAVLQGELEELGLQMPDWHFACSITHVCKIVWPARSSYKQRSMIEMLGIKNESEHRALGDIRALAQLMEKADEKLSGVVRQSNVPLLRDDVSNHPVAMSHVGYRQGDAVVALILQRFEATYSGPKTPMPEIIVSVIVKGGKYLCTRGGAVYHSCTTCYGLRNAARLYEIGGPPSDRRPCSICGRMLKATPPGLSASSQIEEYILSQQNSEYKDTAPNMQVSLRPSQTPALAPDNRVEPLRERISSSEAAKTKYHCAPGGAVYHAKATCSGLRKAKQVYEAESPPPDRRPCRVCMKGQNSSPSPKTEEHGLPLRKPKDQILSTNTEKSTSTVSTPPSARISKRGAKGSPTSIIELSEDLPTRRLELQSPAQNNFRDLKTSGTQRVMEKSKITTEAYFYTRTGKVYHTSTNCRYLKSSTSLNEAIMPPEGRRICKGCGGT